MAGIVKSARYAKNASRGLFLPAKHGTLCLVMNVPGGE